MSAIKRFNAPSYSVPMEENNEGDFVHFEDYLAMLDELGDANARIAGIKATACNPKAADAVLAALESILAHNDAWELGDVRIPYALIEEANNAIAAAREPVSSVPVSEDVETIRFPLHVFRMDAQKRHHLISVRQADEALAALDRLAAAAGRKE